MNDETPTLYLPEVTPGMIASNLADCHSVVRPSFCATASNRSTSKPMIVLPSASRYSFGAYEESVPMVSLPAALISAGTLSASDVSAEAVGTGVPAPVSPDSSPQADRETVIANAALRPTIARRKGVVRNIVVNSSMVFRVTQATPR